MKSFQMLSILNSSMYFFVMGSLHIFNDSLNGKMFQLKIENLTWWCYKLKYI